MVHSWTHSGCMYHVCATYAQTARLADAGRWIRRGLKCSPREFHIQNDTCYIEYPIEIPMELCSGPPGSCRLKKLHLLGLSLNSSFAEQISSVCDLLEELELKSCRIHFQKITSPSLKNLIIDCCDRRYRSEADNQLIITAPYLASLHLKLKARYGPYGFVVLLNEMSSLMKASIHSWISYHDDVVHVNQCEFLSSVSNVTNLELLGFHKRV
jgi:hypothetical protein